MEQKDEITESKENNDAEIGNKKHLVAFLDILGFENHVEKYLNPEKESDKDILTKIKSAYQNALNSSILDFFEKEYYKEQGLKIQYKQFSDCTCLSIPFSGNSKEEDAFIICSFINLLREFYYTMIDSDLLIRGGVAIGCHYEDDNIIFSEGLIKAYKLESKAVFPRIILDDELVQSIKKIWADEDLKFIISRLVIDKQLISDWEGFIFINSLNQTQLLERFYRDGSFTPKFIDEKKDIKIQLVEVDNIIQISLFDNLQRKIRRLKKDETDDNVLMKYIWLKELIKWNVDPDGSKLKFEYLLK